MVSLHPHGPAATRYRARRRDRGVTAHPAAVTSWPPLTVIGLFWAAVAVLMRVVAPDVLDRSSVAIGVVGILIGVPHGSVDHLVPFWGSGHRITFTGLLRVLTTYLLVAAVAIVAFLLDPTLTLVVFLAASAVHFGQAEVEFVAERNGVRRPSTLRTDRLRAAAHGMTVVALPLAVWHDRVHDVITPLAPALAARDAGVVFATVAAVALALDLALLRIDVTAHRRLESAETVMLVLLMAVVPPLPAFAVYFGGWHALRHTGRLLALPGPDGVTLSVRAALRRYVMHALPPTIVVLVALAAVATSGNKSVLTSALIVLIALTFPHMRTVAALDRSRHTTTASADIMDPALT